LAEPIRRSINKRVNGTRLNVDANWRLLLDKHLEVYGSGETDEVEEKAREEKTSALKELAESRLSVLIGPAGTGKTTLLSVLCAHPHIAEGDVFLLAPAGKARVRMEQSTKYLKLTGYTIAQFLSPHRYDASTQPRMIKIRTNTKATRIRPIIRILSLRRVAMVNALDWILCGLTYGSCLKTDAVSSSRFVVAKWSSSLMAF